MPVLVVSVQGRRGLVIYATDSRWSLARETAPSHEAPAALVVSPIRPW